MTSAPARREGCLPGVYRTPGNLAKPWRALLRLPHKVIHLGYHESEQQAHDAWLSARRWLHIQED